MEISIKKISDLPFAAEKLIKSIPDKRIFAFYGSMGAGKTTIIKAICEYLGATDLVSSPTFTIVNEYRTNHQESLYHIDFYRIKKTEEIFDFGVEEYFAEGAYCFMEWPELIEDYLPVDTVKVRISIGDNEERILNIAL